MMRKLDRWQCIDAGGHCRYPLAYNFLNHHLENICHQYGGRKGWLQHYFPELWCWLELNVPHYEWDIGYKIPFETLDLLLVYNVRPLFEAAWEDQILDTV